jgi:hypothetical protein
MSGVAQIFGGLNPQGGTPPATGVPNVANPFDLNSLLSIGNDPAFSGALDLNQILNMGLSPTEQSLVDFLGGQQDTRTRDIYSRLGLGGSTMEAQDLGGNELARLAESAQLIKGDQALAEQDKGLSLSDLTANRGLGLSVQQGTAGVNQNNAANFLTAQGQALTAQQNAFNQGQANLKNITGGLGSLASAAGSLFGG